jgi:hypothetical protein
MDEKRARREEAWIGDAVLSLYARKWILLNVGRTSTELFTAMTSNRFLSCVGDPTLVEAEIGRVYEVRGLDGAFSHISETLLPLFLKQVRNQARGEQRDPGFQEPLKLPKGRA